jgi:hypothetical protein
MLYLQQDRHRRNPSVIGRARIPDLDSTVDHYQPASGHQLFVELVNGL